MCKAKKWLAMLGAVLILGVAIHSAFAGPKPLDEHPWNGYVVGGSSGVAPQKFYTYYQIQFSPTGGFYLVRVSFSVAKAPATSAQQTVKPKQ